MNDFTLQDEFIIDNAENLKVVSDPLRLRILRSLRQPHTVKEIAGRLEIPPTKLYYHVNLLENAGMIKVVETNIVSGIIEKVFQVTARSFRLADDLLMNAETNPSGLDKMIAAVFDDAKGELQRAVARGVINLKNDVNDYDTIWRAEVRLTDAELVDFQERLATWIKDLSQLAFDNRSRKDLTKHSVLVAFHPIEKKKESEEIK